MVNEPVRNLAEIERLIAAEAARKHAEHQRLAEFYRIADRLARIAVQQAFRKAHHYGGFNVGAALYVRMTDGTFRTVRGANRKHAPGPRGPNDYCSEMDGLWNAEDLRCGSLRCEEVIGGYVAAPHRPDDNTAYDLGATILCWHCRRACEKRLARFEQGKPEILRPNTRFVFLNLDNPSREPPDLSVEGILQLCREKDALRSPDIIKERSHHRRRRRR